MQNFYEPFLITMNPCEFVMKFVCHIVRLEQPSLPALADRNSVRWRGHWPRLICPKSFGGFSLPKLSPDFGMERTGREHAICAWLEC